jgi:hypothetical protein
MQDKLMKMLLPMAASTASATIRRVVCAVLCGAVQLP